MNNDLRIETHVMRDDGRDGIFWRNGERWLRENGKEARLLDIAPANEAMHMMELEGIELTAKNLSTASNPSGN